MTESNPINSELDLAQIAQRVRLALVATGASDGKAFAARIGVPYGTMRAYLSAERPPSSEFLAGAYRAYGISPAWVLTGAGTMLEGQTAGMPDCGRDTYVVPVLAVKASAGSGAVNEPSAHYAVGGMAFTAEWLRKRDLQVGNLAVIRVKGSSMEGVLEHGDQLLIDQSDKTPRSGFIYVLRQGDELLVKFCQLLPGGVLRVSSANPNFAPYDVDLSKTADVEIVGRVVAAMHEWEVA
jgi:phage repressor protein C with HTH and peptisase S24 domain